MSQEIKKVDILKGLVEDYNTTKVTKEEYNVAGCVHPLRPGMTAKGRVEPGTSVWDAVREACKAAGVRESFMRRGVAQIGTRDLKNNVTERLQNHPPFDRKLIVRRETSCPNDEGDKKNSFNAIRASNCVCHAS